MIMEKNIGMVIRHYDTYQKREGPGLIVCMTFNGWDNLTFS